MSASNHQENRALKTGAPDTHEATPALIAYIFVLSTEADLAWETIRKLIPQEALGNPIVLPIAQEAPLPATDSWLQHSAAAEYLGVSGSTLYRYAEQHAIESRKLCGRLQYRVSQLEKFKELHIRPARRLPHERVILSPAPTSGK